MILCLNISDSVSFKPPTNVTVKPRMVGRNKCLVKIHGN